MALKIRSVTDSEFDEWSDAVAVGFYNPKLRGTGDFTRSFAGELIEPGRIIGGFDGDRVVGTFRNIPQEVTVPGGASLRVGAVSSVTVAQTHRRRGLLSGMMAHGLRQSVEDGEALSILIPAEYPIYGRYGYGLSTEQANYEVDTRGAALIRPVPGTVEFVSASKWCEEMPAVYERARAKTPGAILRKPIWWETTSGLKTRDGKPTDNEKMFAVYRDEFGTARGYVVYTLKEDHWNHFMPDNQAEVSVLAETPQAQARLLQFLWEQDWLVELSVEVVSVDDSWRHLMANARMAQQTERFDVLWTRVLDVEAALSARTYESEGRLVLAVTDRDGYAEGVFALEGGPEGATCTRTTESPDLTLPAQTLGALYFGNSAATGWAAIGELSEEKHGALAVADRMFKTALPPFCATWF